MDNLIELNGKYYKEVDVVMLEISNEVADIGAKNWYLQNTKVLILDNKKSNLHLLSDEQIQEGDWYILLPEQKIKQAQKDLPIHKDWKKIIATTDELVCKVISKTLGVTQILPQPSPEFISAYIRSYNENQTITKVLVEYIFPETISVSKHLLMTGSDEEMEERNLQAILKLKDNQIVIKKIEEKMYSEGEVIELMKKAITYGTYLEAGAVKVNYKIDYKLDWITQNLK